MTQVHPITPSPELIIKWESRVCGYQDAARWGADQELQACCEWLSSDITTAPAVEYLYAYRRPKPTTLKKQALLGLEYSVQDGYISPVVAENIRRALEQLDD